MFKGKEVRSMAKFRVSLRTALILALTYSAIFAVFGLFMLLGIMLFLEMGFYGLACFTCAILTVPFTIYFLIWREYALLKSKMRSVQSK